MQEKPPNGLRFMIESGGLLVGLDIEVIEPDFVVLDAREGVGEVSLAGPQRLDFRAAQDDASLVSLEDLVVALSLAVGNQIIAHFYLALLGGKPLDDPGRPVFSVTEPVVQPIGPALPEFDPFRR